MGLIKCMCGYGKERGNCTVIRLTAAEKKKLPVGSEDEFFYCSPCLKVIQDPEQGPRYMRGVFEQQLRDSGVPGTRATKLADEYYEELKEMQQNARSKS